MNTYSKILLIIFLLVVTLIVFKSSVLAAPKQLYSQARATWKPVTAASYYNLYYKEFKDKTYKHAVNRVSSNSTWFIISYLKRGITYQYNVAAVDYSGREFSWSGLKKFIDYRPM